MEKNNSQKKRRRIIALLNREEMEFIDKLGMDSLFSTGTKLSRVDIVAAIVDAAMALNISAKDIRSKKELVDKILEAARTEPERRKYPRLKENLIVGFRKMDSMEQYKNAATEDISMGGFKIDVAFLERPLSVNQVIEITIRDPKEKTRPIKAMGRVVWVKKKEDNHSHEIGVMLTYIKKEDEKRFAEHLSKEIEVGN